MKKQEIVPHGWIIVRYMYPYLSLLIIPAVRGIFVREKLSLFLSLEIAAVLIAFLVAVLKRVKFHCVLQENGIYIKKGLFIKKEYFVPISRAVVISVQRNALLKIFKTATLKIYGSYGKETEKIADLPISLKYAEAIENMYNLKVENLIYRCEFLKTLLSSLANSSFFAGLLVLIPLVNQISKIVNASIPDIFVDEIKRNFYDIPQLLQQGVKIITITLILVYIISFLNAFLKNINFNIYKNNDFILIKAGIIPRRTIAFKTENVTAAVLQKSPVLKLFGLYSVRVSVGGYGTETRENCLLLPLVSKKIATLFFEIYFPQIKIETAKIKHPKRAKIRFINPPFIIGTALMLIFIYLRFKFSGLKDLMNVLIIISILISAFWLYCRLTFFKQGGIYADNQNISVISFNIFSEYELHFKTENTEMIKFSSNPFDMRKNLIKIKFYVYGKNKNSKRIKHIDKNSAKRLIFNAITENKRI